MPDNIPRLDQLIHEDLIGYVTASFGEIVSWNDAD
ncbi:hypothetical protein C8E83_1938 [Frondihabitans australicus]|uniref:Uncharacterized protein n=1 Tax=Frondihabitans australicus TaxID=386892 RepID=A0A495IFM6_9MICO|nr:hypothetical protein C8E83_1938 [Frondihabitans australicus]